MKGPGRRRTAVARAVLATLVLALAAGCGRAPAPEGGGAEGLAPATPPDTAAIAAPELPAVREPYVPNGSPMPPAVEAAGIPPYPNAVVYVRHPRRSEVDYLEAFTPDPWDVVVEYYARRLGDWTVTRAEDTVIFELTPDRAAVTVQPWEAEALPPDADPILQRAKTAIGAAWR